MGRSFVVGDIHGAYRALIECLGKASFDYSEDRLICLGDVCDGWPDTRQCIEELLKIRNLVYIKGNHDTWLLDWMKTGTISEVWYKQGGESSIKSYAQEKVPSDHIHLFEQARSWFLEDNQLFVHAGIHTGVPIENQNDDIFLWDRSLARKALNDLNFQSAQRFTEYDAVYIGHTPISFPYPVKSGEVWLMDTGAGWDGVLSMMELASKNRYISSKVPSLYPGVKGRGHKA